MFVSLRKRSNVLQGDANYSGATFRKLAEKALDFLVLLKCADILYTSRIYIDQPVRQNKQVLFSF